MAECIYREAAVNAVLNLAPKVDDDGYCWVIRGDAARAIDSITAAEVRPIEWIPVKERLPGEMDRSCGGWSAEIRPSDDVLVWLSSEKRQSVAWYSHTYNEWTTVDENTVYCFGEVTHWMPLPEPPKEE